jgi:hypothetical protein
MQFEDSSGTLRRIESPLDLTLHDLAVGQLVLPVVRDQCVKPVSAMREASAARYGPFCRNVGRDLE